MAKSDRDSFLGDARVRAKTMTLEGRGVRRGAERYCIVQPARRAGGQRSAHSAEVQQGSELTVERIFVK